MSNLGGGNSGDDTDASFSTTTADSGKKRYCALLHKIMLSALDTFLTFYKRELESDVWMMYVNMPCPSPLTHELVDFCPDCMNKYCELEGRDIPTLAAVRRLANTCKAFDAIIRPSYK